MKTRKKEHKKVFTQFIKNRFINNDSIKNVMNSKPYAQTVKFSIWKITHSQLLQLICICRCSVSFKIKSNFILNCRYL